MAHNPKSPMGKDTSQPQEGNEPASQEGADSDQSARGKAKQAGQKHKGESGRAGASSEFVQHRLLSLDAYRGVIMITLAFSGFGLASTAGNHLKQNPDSPFWQAMQFQFSHVEWVGWGYWDLIQPSFMFMVGVSMAYSYVKRKRSGQSYGRMLFHAVWRSIVLILLGIFLISNWGGSTNWSLVNVLTQIGLGYTFLFLLCGGKLRTQAIAASVILVGTWLMYFFFHGPGIDPVTGTPEVGVTSEWAQAHLAEVGAAWHKNTNVGHHIDLWLLNLLPRVDAFSFNGGGYQTINFVPSLATMLFGLMCGELLRSDRSSGRKFLVLLLAGVGGLVLGLILDSTGLCPLVKRIWTPSWAIFSSGMCCLMLAVLYGVIDILRIRFWAFPLVVIGMNSIAVYCMYQLLRPWTANTLKTHFGQDLFKLKLSVGDTIHSLVDPSSQAAVNLYEPTIQTAVVGVMFWLVCWWMYRNKIFVRI